MRDRWIILRMSYATVAELVAEFGEQFPSELAKAVRTFKPEIVARMLWICARRQHPDLTWEDVLETEPQFYGAELAVTLALQGFLYGSSAREEEKPADDEESVKPKRPLASVRRLFARWKSPRPTASIPIGSTI